MINYIMHFKTGYGDQGCRPLGAHSTIPQVLENTYLCAHGIADTISSKNPLLKFFARLFFKKAAFPFCEQIS